MRYGAAAGVGEEAHSRQPHWCPWSKPVNVETWGHVTGPIVMAHALAELRYGIVARQHESRFKSGRNFNHTPFRGGGGQGRAPQARPRWRAELEWRAVHFRPTSGELWYSSF